MSGRRKRKAAAIAASDATVERPTRDERDDNIAQPLNEETKADSSSEKAADDITLSETKVLKRLEELGSEYNDLCGKEQEMLALLARLQQEEESLAAAIAQIEPPMAAKVKPKKKPGLQHLEEALMQGLDGDSSDSNG